MPARDSIAGGVLVLMVVAAQAFWMGPAIIFLSGCLHFTEEYAAGFQDKGVYRRVPLAYLVVFFSRSSEAWGNGASHPILNVMNRGALCILMGIMLLRRIFSP